jgi:membrane protease YdiL (CAAX protease family)
MLFAMLAQNLMFVVIALFGWRRKGLSLARVGVTWPTSQQVIKALWLGIGLFAIAYTTGWLLENLLQRLLPPIRFAELVGFHQRVTAEGGFRMLASSPSQQIAYVLLGVVAAPIGEEFLFRGLLYRGMRVRWGVSVGAIGSALIFAVLHVSPLAIAGIFLIGVLLALAYERSGSLATPILMHAVNNGLMFMLLWQHRV